MADEFLPDNSYRVFSEINDAVERAFVERGLSKIVSDDGSTNILPGLKRYIAFVVNSFAEGPVVGERYSAGHAAFAEHVSPAMSRLAWNVHVGDYTLTRGLVGKGSLDELAAHAAVCFGNAAGILGRMKQDNRVFGYISRRSMPVIESMQVIGTELEFAGRPNDISEQFGKYFPQVFGRN